MSTFLVILAGVSWGFLGVFLRQISFAKVSAFEVCTIRAIGTSLVLGVILAVWRPRLLRIRWRDLWCFIGGGCVSIFLFNFCYFLTLQRTSIGVAVILLYTSPVFVALLARIFFREPLTRQKILAILMVMIGCVLVSGVCGGQQSLTATGILTGLSSGFCYALYSIFGRCAQQRGYSTPTITFWNFACSALASCAFPRWGFLVQTYTQQPSIWLWTALLVGVSTILPYCCYTAGLARMEASRAAVLVAIEPVVGAIAGIIIYHERLSLETLCGSAFILGALFVQQIKYRGK